MAEVMNKDELVRAVAEKANLSLKDARNSVTATFKVIEDVLSTGDSVALIGFGTFSTADRAERTGRNPQTKESIIIPAKRVPTFKAGSGLKKAVAYK